MNTSSSTPRAHPAAPATNPWLVLAVVGTGALASALMGSSVNIAMPSIRAQYQVDFGMVEWVVTSYLLVTASLMIFCGRLGDIIGHKRVYVTGFALFTLGAVICGFAPSIGYLIAGRVVQALGAAGLWSISAALITAAFPPEKRGQALGMQASLVYVGLTLGPTFGGFVDGWLGWQWIFLLVAPVGVLCFTLSALLLPASAPLARRGFDPAGAVLFAAALAALLAVLSQGGTWGWASPLTLGLLAVVLFSAGAFAWVEQRVAAPMIPFTMFKSVLFSSGISAALVNYATGAMLTFLMPFYLREVRGLTSQEGGLLMSAQAFTMVAVAPAAGWLSDRVGSRGLAAFGLALQGLSLFLVTQLGATAPSWQIMLILVCMGVGVGLFTTPNNSAIMGAAARDRQGVAAGLLSAARTVGMVIGIATAGAIFRGLKTAYLAGGAGGTDAFLGAMSGVMYTGVALAAVGVLLALARSRGASILKEASHHD